MYLRSADRNAYPDSGIVDGIEYQFLGRPLDNAVGAAQIEIGSYTGTGANASTAITLTFPFKPKVVIIAGPDGTAIFMQGAVSSKTDVGSGATGVAVYGFSVTLTWSGNSVTWNGKSNIAGEKILNENGTKYYYVAIG